MTTDQILNHIRGYRALRRINQKQLASRMQMSLNSYSQIERGITNLTVEHLIKIAEILEVTPEELLMGPSALSLRRPTLPRL